MAFPGTATIYSSVTDWTMLSAILVVPADVTAMNFSRRPAFSSAPVLLLRYELSADASQYVEYEGLTFMGAPFHILFIFSLLDAGNANNVAAEK